MAGSVWAALAEPNRRDILDVLRVRECSVNELVDLLGLSQPMTSKHLRVLRDASLVRCRTDAQRRVYAIDPRPMADLDNWLAPYRALWNDSLERLGQHLDDASDRES